jgi:hypothetical protein
MLAPLNFYPVECFNLFNWGKDYLTGVKFTSVTAKFTLLCPVEPGSPREIYICNSEVYFTGVPSGC